MLREDLDDGWNLPGDSWTLEGEEEQGCIAVEMECSAVLAVCRFRGVPASFYGADNLSTDKWEPMDLMEYGIRMRQIYGPCAGMRG